MPEARIKALIKQGEGLRVEFKECKKSLPKDVCQTVTVFLNRTGGDLPLGVKNDGTIVGVDPESIPQIKKDLTTTTNNSRKIHPSAFLAIAEVKIRGKIVLLALVPESSQVHRCNGLRSERGRGLLIEMTFEQTLMKVMNE